MDLTTVDVTDVGGVQEGEEVVLIGRQGELEITVEDVAAWSETISYEVTCGIGSRVPRIPVSTGE
jgi:alanine racemase